MESSLLFCAWEQYSVLERVLGEVGGEVRKSTTYVLVLCSDEEAEISDPNQTLQRFFFCPFTPTADGGEPRILKERKGGNDTLSTNPLRLHRALNTIVLSWCSKASFPTALIVN